MFSISIFARAPRFSTFSGTDQNCAWILALVRICCLVLSITRNWVLLIFSWLQMRLLKKVKPGYLTTVLRLHSMKRSEPTLESTSDTSSDPRVNFDGVI